MKLEDVNREFHRSGISTTCFNCPEILTNSSSIFQGVEVSLYPLLGPLMAIANGEAPEGIPAPSANGKKRAQSILDSCRALLKTDVDPDVFKTILRITSQYLRHPLTKEHAIYSEWPQNNSREQMELMINTSNQLIDLHRSEKELITSVLSEQVFRATGLVQSRYAHLYSEPVVWIGHDTVAEALATGETL